MTSDLAERARGRWRDVLLALGMESKFLTGRNVPCPMCGGRDRFRFVDKRGDGFWVCSQCGNGDGIGLVKAWKGVDFKAAAKLIDEKIGEARVVKPRPADDGRRREALNAIWKRSRPITFDDPAGRYLLSRGLMLPDDGAALRLCPDVRHGDGSCAAMIAKVCAADGRPVTLQQTFLTPEGRKIERKTFWGAHPMGSCVRLGSPIGGVVGIAEGVETALSARSLYGLITWAALDAKHLSAWQPPKGITDVCVFGDNDEKFAGQAAAFALAHRLACDQRLAIAVALKFPKDKGTDWNDVLREKRAIANGAGPRQDRESHAEL